MSVARESPSPAASAARVVSPPSAVREALGVGAAIAAVLFLGGLRIATLPRAEHRATRTAATAVLTGPDQVVYQALLVAVDSVTSMKKKSGYWPDAAALAGEDVPPFASALIPAAARGLAWTSAANGPFADYVGVDASGRRTAFLLRVKEREKGASAEIWFRKGGSAIAAGAYPVREGWFELVALDGDTGPRP